MSSLTYHSALSQPSLLAPPVTKALESLPGADEVQVAEIDPQLSDTAAFCAEYGISADIELLPSSKVEEALTRLDRGDVRYRFVLDLSDLG